MTPEERADLIRLEHRIDHDDQDFALYAKLNADAACDIRRSIAAAIRAAVAEEREACAKLCETKTFLYADGVHAIPGVSEELAKLIRRR